MHEDFTGNRILGAEAPAGLDDFLTGRMRAPIGPGPSKGSLDFTPTAVNDDLSKVDDPSGFGGGPGRFKLALFEGGGAASHSRTSSSSPAFPANSALRRRSRSPTSNSAAQRTINSYQKTTIWSSDSAYVDAYTSEAMKAHLHGMQTLDVDQTLERMFEEARQKIEDELPDDFQLPEFLNADAVKDFVKALGDQREAEAEAEKAAEKDAAAATAEAHSQTATQDKSEDGDDPVHLGLYIDNRLQDDDVEHPEAIRPERQKDNFDIDDPVTTIPIVGVRTEMGWNAAHNVAELYDLNESGTTLVVKGDYFETNAIVQINVYKDNDQVEIAGLPKEKKSITEANNSSNVAEFTKEPAFDVLPVGRFHAGLNWNVDVLDGDFVDVEILEQYNWIYDNDVGVVSTNGVYSRLMAGGNEANGGATIIDYGKYDVIIVLGDYHEANVIYQKNFLIDDDILKAASDLDKDFDGDITQTASWSANTLLNDATIQNIGAQDFEDLSSGLVDLIDAIGRGEVVFDPEVGWQLTGNGTGTLDILYVTGDYYDVNLIHQTNVVADLDTAVQLLPDLAVGDGTEIKQIVSTGENALINEATIFDVGATFHTYLEGEHYEDSILVQAEIVIGDDDNVDRQDTDALVNEVIAFIGSPEDDDSQPSAAPLQDPAQQGDVLNIMS